MLSLLEVALISLLVSIDRNSVSAEYRSYMIGDKIRHCIPYHDCPPGHEIYPCIDEFTNDTCKLCPTGSVQPDLISSPTDSADFKTLGCFKPKGYCIAHDVIASRSSGECMHHQFCKCNLAKCYFGDPCACYHRNDCKPGETMDTNGDCIKCPEGTEKSEPGCGPCKHVTRPRTLPSTETVQLKRIPEEVTMSYGVVTDRKTFTGQKMQEQKPVTENLVVQMVGKDGIKAEKDLAEEDNNLSLYIALIVCLSIVCVVCLMVLLFLCHFRKHQADLTAVSPNQIEHETTLQQQVDIENQDKQDNLTIETLQNDELEPLNNRAPENTAPQNSALITNVGLGLPDVICHKLSENFGDKKLVTNSSEKNYISNAANNVSLEKDNESSEKNEILSAKNCNTLEKDGGLHKDNSFLQWDDTVSSVTNGVLFQVNSDPPDKDGVSPEKNNEFIDLQTKNSGEQHDDLSRTLVTSDNKFILSQEIPKINIVCDDHLHQQGKRLKLNISSLENVSELSCSPIAQETEKPSLYLFRVPQTDTFNKITPNGGELYSSGLGSSVSVDGFSPSLTAKFQENVPQEYSHLVSASDRNTESMDSGLENHNYSLLGVEKDVLLKDDEDILFAS